MVTSQVSSYLAVIIRLLKNERIRAREDELNLLRGVGLINRGALYHLAGVWCNSSELLFGIIAFGIIAQNKTNHMQFITRTD